jgi:predicted GNAT family N-acyltransferase
MIIFRVAETKHDHGWCVAIRTLVFEVEQHVDIGLEVDQHEDACRHILGIDDHIPFAAARWRMALQKSSEWPYSKHGEAGILAPLFAVISDIKSAGSDFKTLRIEAQDYTIPFYEKMGFTIVGDGFLEANIPHHAMEKCV